MRRIVTILTLIAATAATCLAADAKAGQAVYDKSCKQCHGANGTPSAGMAKAMNIKDMKSPEIQAMSNDDMKAVVTAGKGKMKPVTSVTGSSVDDVVAYVKSLK
jgi:mono/diheme cytochrome c family protein